MFILWAMVDLVDKLGNTWIDSDQKALEINLDKTIYGTFAEIGAGQEVARLFFKVGAAAGTIAKSMSAYDKDFSDAIYGREESGRYVCESRLYKMLDHEYELMVERLQQSRPGTKFFVFADTVAAINYNRTIKGHGWLGLRFQLGPESLPNDLVLHVKMLDNTYQLQQSAIGILGVNILYACYNYHNDIEKLVESLMDQLDGRVVIDLVRLSGPDFSQVDNRIIAMLMVKHNLTEVAMFDTNGNTIHASEFLYKKSLMVVRGSYRPPTLVSEDVFKSAYDQFLKEPDINSERAHLMAEITLDNLMRTGSLSDSDFLDRSKAINAMGHMVIISNCLNHQRLINYLSDYKITELGLVIGIRELQEIIREKYEQNQDGRLLVAFGELFTRNIKIFAYPAQGNTPGEITTCANLEVPEGIKFLFQHLLDSEQIVDVENANTDLLNIFGWEVQKLIQENKPGWEEQVPKSIVDIIKSENLFNNPTKKLDFGY